MRARLGGGFARAGVLPAHTGALLLCIALVALLAGTLAMPSAASAAKPRNGHFVGVGDGRLRIDFYVRQHKTVESMHRNFIYPPDSPTPCSTAGNVPGSDDINAKHRFRLETSTATTATVVKGRFVTATKAKGKLIYTQIQAGFCPGTYTLPFTARRFR
jgi:hypothetical protein